ncbi:MAG: ribonuclease HI family protein [Candidatus Komeilibacteria bacterium]
MEYKHLNLYTDGGARGNPGPAAGGYVIKTDDGEIIARDGKYLGETTNNQAEYQGLILGLKKVVELKAEEVSVYMDSELIINQLKGNYKVKNKELASLFVKAWNITLGFKKINFEHIVRSLNKEADAEVNKALDKQKLA